MQRKKIFKILVICLLVIDLIIDIVIYLSWLNFVENLFYHFEEIKTLDKHLLAIILIINLSVRSIATFRQKRTIRNRKSIYLIANLAHWSF